MQRHMSDFYASCRPSVRSGILSLKFIAHLKASEHLKAIELIQKSELKTAPFPSCDKNGKPVLCRADDLTRLFCKSSLSSVDEDNDDDCLLVGRKHRDAVCSFVNKEMLRYENQQIKSPLNPNTNRRRH